MNTTIETAMLDTEKVFAEIRIETGATYEEACIMVSVDCTLEEAQKIMRQEAKYNQLLVDLYPEHLKYFRKEHAVKGEYISEEDLQAEAKSLAEELAYMFVYEWEQYDV